jgi:ribosomal protein S24E
MEKITILNEKENPFFNRKEIVVSIETEITPKIKEAEEFISKKVSTNPENIKIKRIHGQFGSKEFIINANIYSTKEEKEKIESKLKKVKKEVAVKKE